MHVVLFVHMKIFIFINFAPFFFNKLGRPKVRENDLDPMDPAAYSEAPRYVEYFIHLLL